MALTFSPSSVGKHVAPDDVPASLTIPVSFSGEAFTLATVASDQPWLIVPASVGEEASFVARIEPKLFPYAPYQTIVATVSVETNAPETGNLEISIYLKPNAWGGIRRGR